jgi:hypothetical protein
MTFQVITDLLKKLKEKKVISYNDITFLNRNLEEIPTRSDKGRYEIWLLKMKLG